MARHDENISAGRAKMLSRGDTGDRLAEVDEVLGCLVVQTVSESVQRHLVILEATLKTDLCKIMSTLLLKAGEKKLFTKFGVRENTDCWQITNRTH